MEKNRDISWKPHKCKFCSYRSKSKFVIYNHLKLHGRRSKSDTFICDSKPLELLECDFCRFCTAAKVHLTEHFRVSHEGKQPNKEMRNIVECYRCNYCDFASHSVLVYTNHTDNCNSTRIQGTVLRPLQIKRYECEFCAYRTNLKKCLKRHIMARHTRPEDIEWFQCELCPFKTKIKFNLKPHTKKIHGNSEGIKWCACAQCPYRCKENSTLTQHILAKHTGQAREEVEIVRDFQCTNCDFATHSVTVFKNHVDSCGSSEVQIESFKPLVIKWCQCEQCPYKSKDRTSLKRHIVARHTRAEDINWSECAHCDFKCKEKGNLNKHILSKHINLNDFDWFQCAQCEYKSTYKRTLKMHILANHSNPNDLDWFKCGQCAYKSRVKGALRRHIIGKHPRSEYLIDRTMKQCRRATTHLTRAK